jgi:hypothetical protein
MAGMGAVGRSGELPSPAVPGRWAHWLRTSVAHEPAHGRARCHASMVRGCIPAALNVLMVGWGLERCATATDAALAGGSGRWARGSPLISMGIEDIERQRSGHRLGRIYSRGLICSSNFRRHGQRVPGAWSSPIRGSWPSAARRSRSGRARINGSGAHVGLDRDGATKPYRNNLNPLTKELCPGDTGNRCGSFGRHSPQ